MIGVGQGFSPASRSKPKGLRYTFIMIDLNFLSGG